MASISVNFGSSDAYTVKLSWSETSQNVETNKTTLKFTCTLRSNRADVSFSGQAQTDTLTVGGTAYSLSHSAYTVYGGSSVTLWTKTVTVTHDADGTYAKPISVGVMIGTSFSSSGYIGTVTASGTLTCTAIPRASTLSFGAIVLGDTVPLVISRASSSFTHTIAFTLAGTTRTIASKISQTSINWMPSINLAADIPDAKTAPCTLTLTTYSGSTVIGEISYETTAQVPSSLAPTVETGWATAAHYNTGTAAASIAAFVKGYSKAQVTFDASKITTQQGATVKSYKITCNGSTDSSSPYRTPVLNSTSASIVCTVTDSRGFTTSETLDITLYAYSRPKLSEISLYRADTSGNEDASGSCIYAKAKRTYSSIGGLNACTLKGYYRLQTGTYGDGTTMTSGTGKNLTTTALSTVTYIAKIVAEDSLGNTASYETTIPTAAVAFHLKPGGTGAAFGKYAEEDDMLDIAWTQLKLGGQRMADYVVEQGTSGDWMYRKWASGWMELRASISVTAALTETAGALYGCTIAAQALPFAFASTPHFQVTSRAGSQITIATCAGGGSTTQTPRVRLFSMANVASATCIIGYTVTGYAAT